MVILGGWVFLTSEVPLYPTMGLEGKTTLRGVSAAEHPNYFQHRLPPPPPPSK